mmetsp:Transcript_33920/g.39501  ORF Transcript_33920/g.39501 Transcript_33920/m.39501 type:complete len:185 (-) Transcript_33920:16-570(-)
MKRCTAAALGAQHWDAATASLVTLLTSPGQWWSRHWCVRSPTAGLLCPSAPLHASIRFCAATPPVAGSGHSANWDASLSLGTAHPAFAMNPELHPPPLLPTLSPSAAPRYIKRSTLCDGSEVLYVAWSNVSTVQRQKDRFHLVDTMLPVAVTKQRVAMLQQLRSALLAGTTRSAPLVKGSPPED